MFRVILKCGVPFYLLSLFQDTKLIWVGISAYTITNTHLQPFFLHVSNKHKFLFPLRYLFFFASIEQTAHFYCLLDIKIAAPFFGNDSRKREQDDDKKRYRNCRSLEQIFALWRLNFIYGVTFDHPSEQSQMNSIANYLFLLIHSVDLNNKDWWFTWPLLAIRFYHANLQNKSQFMVKCSLDSSNAGIELA